MQASQSLSASDDVYTKIVEMKPFSMSWFIDVIIVVGGSFLKEQIGLQTTSSPSLQKPVEKPTGKEKGKKKKNSSKSSTIIVD